LSTYPEIPIDLIDCFSPVEWKQRCELAVSYRIAYLHDWHLNIFNHITLKVDGSDEETDGPHFLLNDFGLGFDEITACNLLKVNLDGMIVDQPTPLPANRRTINRGKGRVFKPGYVLHSALHAARDDVHAIWHGHDQHATAVSQTTLGILPLSQEATYALSKGISYHPFEGSANDLSEQPRIVRNLGPTNQILMLEDHGPIIACPRIEEAFAVMYFLTRACKYQIKSLSAVGGDLRKIHMPAVETLDEMFRRMDKFDKAPSSVAEVKEVAHDTPGLMFAYARRSAEKAFGPNSIYT
jgi:ribulose-5-phosphate 4-epimerase/fuculose-1-phosphate aldolase